MTMMPARMHQAVTSSTAAQVIATDPTPGAKHITLSQNASQYRECGDAHCRAHEQSKAAEADALVGQSRIKINGKQRAQNEGRDDAYLACHYCRAAQRAKLSQIKLEANQKHEYQETHLAQRIQLSEARRRKQIGRYVRG